MDYPETFVLASVIFASLTIVITFMILTFRLIKKGTRKE